MAPVKSDANLGNMTVRSNVIYGLFPSDIILRTAILEGIADVKANPGLIDFLFQSLLKDTLTVKAYGEKELNNCKNWILENDIAVTMGYHINQVKGPHIAIWLGGQEETQQILADIHDTHQEEIAWTSRRPPTLTFTPTAYDQTTGVITLASNVSTAQVHAGMRVFDRVNNQALVIEDVGSNFIKIKAGTVANLTNAEVIERSNTWIVKAESVTFKETFNIDVLVTGDATKCILLHQLLVFVLYRYKQKYLEARGLENTIVASTAMGGVQPDASQIIWKRSVILTGYTRQYWPKDIGAPVQGIDVSLDVLSNGDNAAGDQSWRAVIDEDALDDDADSIIGNL